MLKLGYECRTGIVQCDGAHANPPEERYSLTSRAGSSAERIGCRDALWVGGGNTWSSSERTRHESMFLIYFRMTGNASHQTPACRREIPQHSRTYVCFTHLCRI